MQKKDKDKERSPDIIGADDAIEERVKKMLDPSEPDVATQLPVPEPVEPDFQPEPPSAPEISGLPIPSEPTKIKIIKEGEEDTPEVSKPAIPELDEEPYASPPEQRVIDGPEDPRTAAAVDDIIAHESDELLAIEDKRLAAAPSVPKSPKTRGFFKRILTSARTWWVLTFLVLLSAAAAAVLPQVRYPVLNYFGVRAALSVKVLDQSTQQPLRNTRVSAAGTEGRTDENGEVTLDGLKLGPTELKIEKPAFSSSVNPVTIGWGSNPQGDVYLTPSGKQYAFVLVDYVSGKPIHKAEASSGEASAFSDDDGKVLLAIDEPDDEISVRLTAKDYRTETVKIPADMKGERKVALVPARKHVYISEKSGTYDVYKADLDGKNEKLLLKGTETTRSDLVLVPHPSEDVVALVSVREDTPGTNGLLPSTLMIIDLKTDSSEAVVTSEQVQLIGWSGTRIVYVQVAAGADEKDPKRQLLTSYDYKSDDTKELSAANYFNAVLMAGGKVYYAPSGAFQNGVNVSLFQIEPNGDNRVVILAKEVWNLYRTAYDHIAISRPGEWYDYRVGSEKPAKLGAEPKNLASRVFETSPNGSRSLWVAMGADKDVLYVHDNQAGTDKVLLTQAGIKTPVRWINDTTAVYRLDTITETADYAISLSGGKPKKITDVADTGGIDSWYYH